MLARKFSKAGVQVLPAVTLSAAILGLVLGALAASAVEPPPTPRPTPDAAPQHVTVPSLPGQPNQEGTVKPDGGLATDSEGNSATRRLSASTGEASPTPQAESKPAAEAPSTTPASGVTASAPSNPAGPASPGTGAPTGASYLTVRGVVRSFEAGKSVTVRFRKSRSVVTYTLAPDAAVPADLRPGETVRVRVVVAGKGRVADRVDRGAGK